MRPTEYPSFGTYTALLFFLSFNTKHEPPLLIRNISRLLILNNSELLTYIKLFLSLQNCLYILYFDQTHLLHIIIFCTQMVLERESMFGSGFSIYPSSLFIYGSLLYILYCVRIYADFILCLIIPSSLVTSTFIFSVLFKLWLAYGGGYSSYLHNPIFNCDASLHVYSMLEVSFVKMKLISTKISHVICFSDQ